MSPHERLTVFLAEHWKGISYLPEEVEESNPQEEGTVAHKSATCSTRRPRGEGRGGGGDRRRGGGGQKEGRISLVANCVSQHRTHYWMSC